jgi:hypothetical protein
MSQQTARPDPQVKSRDEDPAGPQARQPGRKQEVRPRKAVGQPDGDGGAGPDEPDEDEFELIGGNDLGDADLGPAAPDAPDPDARSGRVRKIARENRRDN